MSREIKFDIITLHTSGLKHYEHLIVTLDELIKLIPRKITGHVDLWRFSGEIIAKRQFTGLTDKNGKEIYEGDIVKWWHGHMFGKDQYYYLPVEFHQGQVGPCKGGNVMEWRMGHIHNLWNGSDVEVVGNIHENPELLNAPPGE